MSEVEQLEEPIELPIIAYVVNSLNPGGTERLVVDMSLASLMKFSIVVICLDEPGTWVSELRSKGVPVYCLWRQSGLDLSMAVRLARLFRKSKVDIIHAHQSTPWIYGALSRILYSEPKLLFQEHGRFFPERLNRKRRWINRLVIKRLTHRFVAVSKDIKSRLVMYEGLDPERIEVVYNGVALPRNTTSESKRALRAEFDFDDSDFVVGTVGRLDCIKNLPLFVEGIESALKHSPNIKGVIVGGGPEQNRIQEYIDSRGLADKIILAGFRNDARRLIHSLDLFALVSFSEGTSMALLEATVAEIPAVVTDVGGNPEVVLEGETGWVIPSGSVDGLASAILDVIEDRKKARALAVKGRQRLSENFLFDQMIESYHGVYRDMLSA